MRSAIARRSTGECFDNKSGGDRCFRCSSGHVCQALPASAVHTAQKFVNARAGGASTKVSPLYPTLLIGDTDLC